MNTTKTKSYFSSRWAKIVVLMALLAYTLPSMAYDFEVMYSDKPMYFNIISDDEVCITYKDTTYNPTKAIIRCRMLIFFEMREVTWRCMGIPEKVTYNNKTYRVTANWRKCI